jgi:hypothetical protein
MSLTNKDLADLQRSSSEFREFCRKVGRIRSDFNQSELENRLKSFDIIFRRKWKASHRCEMSFFQKNKIWLKEKVKV